MPVPPIGSSTSAGVNRTRAPTSSVVSASRSRSSSRHARVCTSARARRTPARPTRGRPHGRGRPSTRRPWPRRRGARRSTWAARARRARACTARCVGRCHRARLGGVHAEHVLRHVHADAAHEPEGPRVGTQHVGHRRDRVGHVVAAGAAVVRQPAGHRERPWIVVGDAERVAREVHASSPKQLYRSRCATSSIADARRPGAPRRSPPAIAGERHISACSAT